MKITCVIVEYKRFYRWKAFTLTNDSKIKKGNLNSSDVITSRFRFQGWYLSCYLDILQYHKAFNRVFFGEVICKEYYVECTHLLSTLN